MVSPSSVIAKSGKWVSTTINKLSNEESGFKINTKLQSCFLIMLLPICAVLFPKKFISYKRQELYLKAIVKGISSSVHNPEEHLP